MASPKLISMAIAQERAKIGAVMMTGEDALTQRRVGRGKDETPHRRDGEKAARNSPAGICPCRSLSARAYMHTLRVDDAVKLVG